MKKVNNPHPASAATLSHRMGEGLGVRAVHGSKDRDGVTDGTRTRNIQNHNLGLYH